MDIVLGNAKEMASLVKIGLDLLEEFKKDGSLEKAADGIFALCKRLRQDMALLDIEQRDTYMLAGLSAEEALSLVIENKRVISGLLSKKQA